MVYKKPTTIPALKNWKELNMAMRTANEVTCRYLLEQERRGKKRSSFLVRIHNRMNKLRAQRERKELVQ